MPYLLKLYCVKLTYLPNYMAVVNEFAYSVPT